MATPNYSFEKRRRDLDKKAKKEEKKKRKLAEKSTTPGTEDGEAAADGDATAEAAPAEGQPAA